MVEVSIFHMGVDDFALLLFNNSIPFRANLDAESPHDYFYVVLFIELSTSRINADQTESTCLFLSSQFPALSFL